MIPTSVGEGFQIAVLLPCRNVAGTIGPAVRGFLAALPGARIYVFDNNSTDDTAREAAHAGARVFREGRQGKGAVVRRMFADIEADVYLMAAGDGSCDPADAPSLVNALVTEHVDMVVGVGPALGRDRANYRAFTRRFVKSFPAVSDRLGIEAEMSVHARQLMIPVAEIELSAPDAPRDGARPAIAGSPAGWGHFALLTRETQPSAFYGLIAALFAMVGALLLAAGLFASAPAGVGVVIGAALLVIAAVLTSLGLTLEALNRSRIEQKRILFLAVPALGAQ